MEKGKNIVKASRKVVAKLAKKLKPKKSLKKILPRSNKFLKKTGKLGGKKPKKVKKSKVVKKVSAKSINDILIGAKETTRKAGKARNLEKSGGYGKALEDFKALQPKKVKEIDTQYGKGKFGTLSDGTTISVRPGSKTGGSTIEIKVPGQRLIKIRY